MTLSTCRIFLNILLSEVKKEKEREAKSQRGIPNVLLYVETACKYNALHINYDWVIRKHNNKIFRCMHGEVQVTQSTAKW